MVSFLRRSQGGPAGGADRQATREPDPSRTHPDPTTQDVHPRRRSPLHRPGEPGVHGTVGPDLPHVAPLGHEEEGGTTSGGGEFREPVHVMGPPPRGGVREEGRRASTEVGALDLEERAGRRSGNATHRSFVEPAVHPGHLPPPGPPRGDLGEEPPLPQPLVDEVVRDHRIHRNENGRVGGGLDVHQRPSGGPRGSRRGAHHVPPRVSLPQEFPHASGIPQVGREHSSRGTFHLDE